MKIFRSPSGALPNTRALSYTIGGYASGIWLMTLPASVRIYVAAEPVDLRRGFDGLAAATRSLIRQDPLSGHVFVFVNRRRSTGSVRQCQLPIREIASGAILRG